MLQSLYVKNYAIIQNLRVEFSEGLNILSGETGAGKSIIVGSLSLLLGSRASTDMIRAGEKKLTVEGVFSVDNISDELKSVLEENDIEYDDGLIIRREVTDSGKNTCRINDVTVSVAYLKNVGTYLVDIHGQHEHQRLLSEENHIKYLDDFGGDELKESIRIVGERYENMRAAARLVGKLKKEQKETLEKKDEYLQAVKEIEKISPQPDEDESVSARLKVLESAEKIYTLVDVAYDNLYASNYNVAELISEAVYSVEKAGEYDESILKLIPILNEAVINIGESINELRNYRSSLEFEPYELENLNERLSEINRLKRKYGEINEILDKYNNMKLLLEGMENMDYDMSEAMKNYEDAKAEYLEAAGYLSAQRKKAAEEFSGKLISELSDMAMKDAAFEVRFENKKESEDGIDEVAFFISTNKGQPLRELSKTASGGEISRIMLALKSLIGLKDGIDTMIFDEIDTGISGNTAMVVARKMADLSKNKQIIAITHLAQIASHSDSHFLIRKSDEDEMTSTTLCLIEGEDKIREVARIIGSSESETAVLHAKSMIEEAEGYKRSI